LLKYAVAVHRDAVIIGAGVAGLAAAELLSREGLSVAVLEARSRIGGRVWTRRIRGWPLPVELGAEFVHGPSEEIFAIASSAGLLVDRLPDTHFEAGGARLRPLGDIWARFDRMTRKMRRSGRDRSVAEFLRTRRDLSGADRRLLRSLVEGYDAAPLDRASEHALSTAGEPRSAPGDHAQFRVISGYSGVPAALASRLDGRRCGIHLSTAVRAIRWRRGEVRVLCGDGRTFRAPRAIVTIPAGVLKAAAGERGTIAFDPDPRPLRRALEGIEMGDVVRLVLRFRRAFWLEEEFLARVSSASPRENGEIAFLHSFDAPFPTWWTASPARVPMLVAWSGGPRARALLGRRATALLDEALRTLGRIAGCSPRSLRRLLSGWHFWNWSADPYSRGAYSYQAVGGADCPDRLAEPIEKTLFFAGEATDGSESGTVPGAIRSGRRAARRVLR
jgi:monoamine oxidase